MALIEAEADFINTDHKILNIIKTIATEFVSSSFLKNSENQRPSTSYTKTAKNDFSNYLVSLLYTVSVCNDLDSMLLHTTNNQFSSQILKIYTDIPVEFKIWKHENQMFWARLVHAFYERLEIKQYVEVNQDSDEEDNENIIVPKWSVS